MLVIKCDYYGEVRSLAVILLHGTEFKRQLYFTSTASYAVRQAVYVRKQFLYCRAWTVEWHLKTAIRAVQMQPNRAMNYNQ